MMALIYPLTMSLLSTQRFFRWMPNSLSCTECSSCPAESHWYPAYANRPLKVVARCRMMSHDAQVNTCYNVNCQRRTREHDAALHRRKPAMGSSSSCRAHHEAPFRRQIGKHLHLAALVHFLPSSRDSFSVLPSHLLDTLPGTNRAPKSCRTMSYNVAQSRETPTAICAIM